MQPGQQVAVAQGAAQALRQFAAQVEVALLQRLPEAQPQHSQRQIVLHQRVQRRRRQPQRVQPRTVKHARLLAVHHLGHRLLELLHLTHLLEPDAAGAPGNDRLGRALFAVGVQFGAEPQRGAVGKARGHQVQRPVQPLVGVQRARQRRSGGLWLVWNRVI